MEVASFVVEICGLSGNYKSALHHKQCSLYENSELSNCSLFCARSTCYCATMQTHNQWNVPSVKKALRYH